jgi:hypothetical protein
MAKEKAIIRDRIKWRTGERVFRKDTEEQGTISEANNQIKVKWDGGKTSYYHRKTPANLQLIKIK